MNQTSSQGEKAARRTLVDFMVSWKTRDWEWMAELSQITWREEGHPGTIVDKPGISLSGISLFRKTHEQTAAEWLERWLGPHEIESFLITRTSMTSDTLMEAEIKVIRPRYFGVTGKEVTINARVICETAPYMPSADGTWGVNPVSCLRGWNK